MEFAKLLSFGCKYDHIDKTQVFKFMRAFPWPFLNQSHFAWCKSQGNGYSEQMLRVTVSQIPLISALQTTHKNNIHDADNPSLSSLMKARLDPISCGFSRLTLSPADRLLRSSITKEVSQQEVTVGAGVGRVFSLCHEERNQTATKYTPEEKLPFSGDCVFTVRFWHLVVKFQH